MKPSTRMFLRAAKKRQKRRAKFDTSPWRVSTLRNKLAGRIRSMRKTNPHKLVRAWYVKDA